MKNTLLLINFRTILLDFKQLSKSKTFYLKLVLFPMVLIVILSKALGSTDGSTLSFSLAVCNEDLGNADSLSLDKESAQKPSEVQTISFGDTLVKEVLRSKEAAHTFHVITAASYQEGVNLVRDKKASVFIYIPKDFTKAILSREKNGIILTGGNDTSLDKSIVTGILEQFLRSIQLILAENKAFAVSGISDTKSLSDLSRSAVIPEISTNPDAVPVSAMQYVSIAMVVLFSISTAFTLIHKIVEEKLTFTLFRIKTTPAHRFQYVFGKLCSIVFTLTLQMCAVILLTRLIFGMKWGNPGLILLTTLTYAFAIGSPILMWGLLAKNQNAVSSLASPVLYGLGFLGGSFISIDALPRALQQIQNIIPNGKALNSYLLLCEGKNFADIDKNLLELFLMGILFLILTLLIDSGKEIIRHGNMDSDKNTIKASVF